MRVRRHLLVVAGAGALLAAALLFRRAPPPRAARPAEAPAVASAPERPAPAAEAKASPPAPAAPKPRDVLAGLARALRDGDERAARELLDALRARLLPPVDPKDDAAPLYRKAIDVLRPILQKFDPEERRAWGLCLAGQPVSAADRELLAGWFERHRETFEEGRKLLIEAAEKPECRFPPGEVDGAGVDGNTAIRLQSAAQLLVIHSSVTGDGASMAAELGLSRALRSDPAIMSQLIACAMDTGAAEVLRRADLGSPALARALESLDPATPRRGYERALLGEALWIGERAIGTPADRQAAGAYVEALSEIARLSTRPHQEVRLEIDALARQHGTFAPAYAGESKRLIPALPRLTEIAVEAESRLAMLRLAASLSRHRARFGAYPPTLAEGGPADPFTGRSFDYRPEGAGFILESAGPPSKGTRVTWTFSGP